MQLSGTSPDSLHGLPLGLRRGYFRQAGQQVRHEGRAAEAHRRSPREHQRHLPHLPGGLRQGPEQARQRELAEGAHAGGHQLHHLQVHEPRSVCCPLCGEQRFRSPINAVTSSRKKPEKCLGAARGVGHLPQLPRQGGGQARHLQLHRPQPGVVGRGQGGHRFDPLARR